MPRPFHLLSIDIDAFVDPVARDIEEGEERLPNDDDEYKVDALDQVQCFLENACLLSQSTPVRGIHIRDHDEAFGIVEALHKEVGQPIVLHHVDAHADLGSGDAGYVYLLREWLWCTVPRPRPTELGLGNWLAFVAANGWLALISYSAREPTPMDFPNHFGCDFYPPTQLRFAPQRVDRFNTVVATGPELCVPLSICTLRDFHLERPPDYVIFCQSPNFTPERADAILEWTRGYVKPDSLGLALRPLWRSASSG